MKLPVEIRERFRSYGRSGGQARAERMEPAARRRVARVAALARWTRKRFGDSSFEALGLPGGDLVDAGLADLAAERVTLESLLVSLAAPRLKREGVPIAPPTGNPEDELYELLSAESGELAHARYGAYLRRIVSFADACRGSRIDRNRRAS